MKASHPAQVATIEPAPARERASLVPLLLGEIKHAFDHANPRFLAWSICASVLPEFTFPRIRTSLFRLTGADVRSGSALLGRIKIVGGPGAVSRLCIRSSCVIGPGVTFGLDAPITVGIGVSIGPGVTLCTGTHALGPASRRMSKLAPRPIVVEDGAWIGMNALILPGVRIGRGSVVSAGSVVTEDVAPNTFVSGNPAHAVQTLPLTDR